jgi:hypothetical protein
MTQIIKVEIGKGMIAEVDKAALAAFDNVAAHVWYIGLKNILGDAHANATEKNFPDAKERQAAADAMWRKKLDAMMQGELRVHGQAAVREPIDPIGKEAARLARLFVHKATKDWQTAGSPGNANLVAAAKKRNWECDTSDKLKDCVANLVNEYAESEPYVKAATKNLEAVKGLPTPDLTDL